MTELTAESTFRECAEFYLINKLVFIDKNKDVISQKTKCKINIYPEICDITIRNLNYADCTALMKKLNRKKYSYTYICACWRTIKQVVNMAVDLSLIEKPDFSTITCRELLNDIEFWSKPQIDIMKPLFKNIGNHDDFVITRHSSVLSYLIYLYNKNDERNHHILPPHVINCIYKNTDGDIINKPIREVNHYDIKKMVHDIKLLGYCPGYIKRVLQLLRFVFSSAYGSGLIDSPFDDYFKFTDDPHLQTSITETMNTDP